MPANKALARLKAVLKSKKDDSEKAVIIIGLAPELPDEAISVLDDALDAADPILQVAIMDAYYEMTGDKYHEQDLENILASAAKLKDKGEQVYMAARVALGRINGLSMDRLDEWGDGKIKISARAQRKRSGKRVPSSIADSITIIIHGTWAADGTWWRPGGDFFEYVKADLDRTDLYGKADQFKWSGKNRDNQRRQAALALHKWLQSHPAGEINVFAHSHGANVAMLATHHSISMKRLIMLSPPVRSDYFAKWDHVGQAYNIQASYDPVVAIARGGKSFDIKQVKEKVLKASGHSSSHDPQVWRDENIGKFVSLP